LLLGQRVRSLKRGGAKFHKNRRWLRLFGVDASTIVKTEFYNSL
jgi:hypothetical protein